MFVMLVNLCPKPLALSRVKQCWQIYKSVITVLLKAHVEYAYFVKMMRWRKCGTLAVSACATCE